MVEKAVVERAELVAQPLEIVLQTSLRCRIRARATTPSPVGGVAMVWMDRSGRYFFSSTTRRQISPLQNVMTRSRRAVVRSSGKQSWIRMVDSGPHSALQVDEGAQGVLEVMHAVDQRQIDGQAAEFRAHVPAREEFVARFGK